MPRPKKAPATSAAAETIQPIVDSKAAQILLGKAAVDARKAMDAIKKDVAENVHAMHCGNKDHDAIWFTENPRNKIIHRGMWYSIYHDAGDVWPIQDAEGRLDPIPWCQECALTGDSRRWPVPGLRAVRMRDNNFGLQLTGDAGHYLKTIKREDIESRQAAFKEAYGAAEADAVEAEPVDATQPAEVAS